MKFVAVMVKETDNVQNISKPYIPTYSNFAAGTVLILHSLGSVLIL